MPAVIAKRYRVIRELGRGGMGVVYLVKHMHTGESLALKLLLSGAGAPQDAVERFKREMRAPARIRSEYVVRVTDADVAPELDGAPFLVMELLDGCDLTEVLKQRKKLSPEEVVWILHQVAKALDKSHALGIVHRDLKPGNLFLHRKEDQRLIVKLLDFGIARLTTPANLSIDQEHRTQTGAILGTPAFLSPEQARGDSRHIGPPSDIWAVGMIAFRMLTGESFWIPGSLANLLSQVLIDPIPPATQRAPSLPKAFDAWFEKSCHRDPTQRWTSVGEQVTALADALSVNPDSVSNATMPGALYEFWQALKVEIQSEDEPEESPSDLGSADNAAPDVPVPFVAPAGQVAIATQVSPVKPTMVAHRAINTPPQSQVLRWVALIALGTFLCASILLLVFRHPTNQSPLEAPPANGTSRIPTPSLPPLNTMQPPPSQAREMPPAAGNQASKGSKPIVQPATLRDSTLKTHRQHPSPHKSSTLSKYEPTSP